jgi:hypothetical protein
MQTLEYAYLAIVFEQWSESRPVVVQLSREIAKVHPRPAQQSVTIGLTALQQIVPCVLGRLGASEKGRLLPLLSEKLQKLAA